MSSWLPEVREVLEASRWFPECVVDTSIWRSASERAGLAWHDAAEGFLKEFGGLTVNISGPGISCARTPFELDPELARGEEDRFTEWGETIGRSLVPLGELDHGRFFLAIDESGEIYLVETWVASFGPMPQALENLVLDVAPLTIDDGYRPARQAP
ncbi:SUKH-3 domain-containing protein [Streptomyces sp. HNM0645]|uniref:SUKH-3 domain-containing protein n=1 Tax=Streptomyces sp. HNM0645 TaxID=2782343 RepID=UPI0024B6DDFA|nr:SUKH-3 domain-containing protein [Streptomyces sp. HNM0645]MDI9889007.1 SUKH-3 domain-containing protein [Streptomyces sp. HNM0645]